MMQIKVYFLVQINIARILRAPIDDPLMDEFGGLKPCLSSWKSAGSRLACQPEGLPCIEQAALALRIYLPAPEDHDELIRNGEEFIEEWESKR